MNLAALDWILWVAGFVSSGLLFVILLYRHRWKEFPCFTAYFGSSVFMTVVVYSIYKVGPSSWYASSYYITSFIDEALQLAVLWEVARIVMSPTGTWVQDARRQFFLGGAIGILLALLPAFVVLPPTSNPFAIAGVRIGVFTGCLVCELFLVVTLTSNRLGLGWRNHVMSLILGWSAWAATAVIVDGIHSYFGGYFHYKDLVHLRMIVFQASQIYWIVQFWRDEPARRPIPPELAAYIRDLHIRVQKNLDTVGAQR